MRTTLFILAAALRLSGQGAAVEGTVTEAATGRPVRNVEVTLLGLTKSGNPPDTDNYVAETDRNGHFLVEEITPGKYEATASRAGYANRPAARITISAGQRAAVELKLLPTGVISGRILNMNGEPVADATVEAMQEEAGRQPLQPRGSASSDDRGEYRIFGLAPGQYHLRVAESAGGQDIFHLSPQRAVQTFGRTDYPAALEVTAGGELRNVEIRLRLAFPRSIRGIVPYPHTNAFSVSLQRRGDSSGGRPPYSMYSTTDEEFTFGEVMPGSYVVFTTIHDPTHPEQALFGRQEVEVVDRDLEGITLPLIPMKAVSGRVTADGPLAFPFFNMNVELDPDNPDSPTVTARVSADGTFQVEVLPESYLLTRPRIATAYVKRVKMGDGEAPDFRIDFARRNGPLQILLGTDGGKVEGVVKDAEGSPAAAARITMIPKKGWNARVRSTNSDEEGKFELAAVAPGEYKVFAGLDAGQGVSVLVEPNSNKVVEVTVK